MTTAPTLTRPSSRGVVPVALVVVTAACWAYLFLLTLRMGDMQSPLSMPMTSAWSPSDAFLMWTMWAVMMAGMMLPSAIPMVNAYTVTVKSERANLEGSPTLFVVGYLAMWAAFGLAATMVQWALHELALVNAMGESTSRGLGGVLLVGAGVYQFTGAKEACLDKCRAPLGFLLSSWRAGGRGALVMGLHHGTLCVGCCWALMAVLFVLGVMNLWWIALVSAVVLVEKFIPGDQFTRVLGTALVAWGALLSTGAV